jgi:transposase
MGKRRLRLPATGLGETKLTPEMEARIVALLKEGNSLQCAADAVGISKSTLIEWRNLGAEGDERYRTLSDRTKAAQAETEARRLGIIEEAAQGQIPGQWQAAAWLLERSKPKSWSLSKQRVEVKAAVVSAVPEDRDTQVALAKFVLAANGESE